VDYGSQIEPIKRRLKPLSVLRRRNQAFEQIIAKSLRELQRPAEDFGWLPVKHTRGFWTALVDQQTGYPANTCRSTRIERPRCFDRRLSRGASQILVELV
jgi:hypothetical protein